MKYPPKTTKPIHPVYGKALGYRCPVCIGTKGYKVESRFGGKTMCAACDGGRIMSKDKYREAVAFWLPRKLYGYNLRGMTMTLHLALKRKYFEAIKAGTKAFEYRLYNDYWCKRISGKTFGKIILTLGYPKRDDQSRRLERPWRGYHLHVVTHPQFGSNPVKVFMIRVN